MPASKDRRVRVEGFSKISATERPSSTREESGCAFSASARSSRWSSSSAVELRAGEQMVGHEGGQSTIAAMELRVLSWNLFHGRSVPETRGSLLDEFAAALASWDWHVALLQEVLPWWPRRLAARTGAQWRRALTSRNELLPITGPVAAWRPDLVKSWGGGSNAILVREQAVLEHRAERLRWWPERRVVHAVLLESGVWVGNLHASKQTDDPDGRDVRRAPQVAEGWAGGGPLVLGGDFNVVAPRWRAGRTPRAATSTTSSRTDCTAAGPGTALDHGILSDHRPVLARLSFP